MRSFGFLVVTVTLAQTAALWAEMKPISTLSEKPTTVAGCQLTRVALSEGKEAGCELITIDNGQLAITVVPTRGLSILRVTHNGESILGWNSPVKEVVHPSLINLESRGGLGWLEGFNEWMVRCGLEYAGHPGLDSFVDNTGAEAEMNLTLHGKICNIPATKVEYGEVDGRLVLRGIVNETLFFGPKLQLTAGISTKADSMSFQIKDHIVNNGSAPQEMMLLYHCNFGRPILEEGAEVVVAAESIRPMNDIASKAIDTYGTYAGPTAGFIEQVYLVHPKSDADSRTAVLLKNKTGDKGCSLEWSTRELPYLTIWKNTVDERDGYVTGLEPGSCFPYNRHHERKMGRVKKLEAGKDYHFAVDVNVHATAESVSKSRTWIETLQGNDGPEMFIDPEEHE